jgi:hypothetical protein
MTICFFFILFRRQLLARHFPFPWPRSPCFRFRCSQSPAFPGINIKDFFVKLSLMLRHNKLECLRCPNYMFWLMALFVNFRLAPKNHSSLFDHSPWWQRKKALKLRHFATRLQNFFTSLLPRHNKLECLRIKSFQSAQTPFVNIRLAKKNIEGKHSSLFCLSHRDI